MIESLPVASTLIVAGFVILPIVMVLVICAGLLWTVGKRAAVIGLIAFITWLTLTGVLAASGFFDAWMPPRLIIVLGTVLAVLIWASKAEWAARLGTLPLNLLVGFQAFRIIVELLIHEAVAQGVASTTLTWTGTNFDILSGLSAILLAPFVRHVSRGWLQVWNISAALILVFTVAAALLAMSTPFQQIFSNPPNVWIAAFPFVWLPGILVLSALLGHVVLFRRLLKVDHLREKS
ncbi:MAG: hypothetical protein AB2604_02650 [Candidatus Thiodiazotropha taylori]